ncbi:NXPE family member 3-like [Clarias gariepinus]
MSGSLTFTLTQIKKNIQLPFGTTESLWLPKLNDTYCAHLGQDPTAEEAKEERFLLNSIAWPGPLVQGLPVKLSSNPAKSYYVIQSSAEQRVGGQLVVVVHMKNFLGLPKNHGGDFLIARLHSPELGAGVAGKVYDHQNGTYTVLFPLLWAEVVQVQITMVHPSEAVVVLKRLQKEQPDRVFFKSQFRSGSISEITECNLFLPFNQKPVMHELLISWFNDSAAITHCLRGKLVYMFGDSTVRQWFEYLTAFVPEFNIHSPKKVGPFIALDKENNIRIQFRIHGPPIRSSPVFSSELRYIANELDRIQDIEFPTMERYLRRYVIIFTLLAVTGFVLLHHNMTTLKSLD